MTKTRATQTLSAVAAALSLALTMSLPATAQAAPEVEEIVMDAPTYVVAARAPGAPMATAGLPVDVVVFEADEGATLQVARNRPDPAPVRLASVDVMVVVHR